MKTRKALCAVLAATMLAVTAFASCGESSSKTSDSSANSTSTTAVETKEKTAKDLNAIANGVKDTLDDAVKGTMTEYDENRIEKIIGVKKDLYTKAVCLVDASGASAHEIDCFEAKDENAAKDIESALKTRIENQKTAFKDYVPAEMDKLNDPVLVVDSNYVFLCLTNNNSKAKEVIGK